MSFLSFSGSVARTARGLLTLALSSLSLVALVCQAQGNTSGTAVAATKTAAAKAFSEGKQVFLYGLAPNPIVTTDLRTWKCSVSFIRSKAARVAMKDVKLSIVGAGVTGALPHSALRVSGEAEGSIVFEVSYQYWMSGGIVVPGTLKLTLMGPDGDVSNAVELTLDVKFKK